MKFIDMNDYKRKKHFDFYLKQDYPHMNLCANVEITRLADFLKSNKLPFYFSLIYLSMRTVNQIREFRHRIRERTIIEHEIIHPSFSVMAENDLFSFCTSKYSPNFHTFLQNAQNEAEKVKTEPFIDDEPGRDDLVYITCLPWVSFTSISHPIHLHPVDSIPRIAWGKYFKDNGKLMLPFSVQVHHALLDGVHIGRFFTVLQEILDEPEKILL
ncbi:MAG: chloramphenicol acetyltransferase [Candidatus Cloacimonadales bacterium]|nr:chloramphenicol acetyltransferase [Candidatus Cloacimonadales bacterium]